MLRYCLFLPLYVSNPSQGCDLLYAAKTDEAVVHLLMFLSYSV
jgi:hypothetical protein